MNVSSWIAVLVGLCLVAPTASSNAAHDNRDGLHDPVYVYYQQGSCREESMEVEVFDRENAAWAPHPRHPMIPIESCQLEDAGTLLQEIRWRCIETRPAALPPTWVVGLDVFDPQVMERCAGDGRVQPRGEADIVISSPRPGATVRGLTESVEVAGSVRIDGIGGATYDVVVALDVSRRVGRGSGGVDVFRAEVGAARSFVNHVSHRLGDVRVGIVTFPNRQVSRNDPGGTGARRDAVLGASYAELDRALRNVEGRGNGSFQSFASGLDFALSELSGENPGSGARPHARKLLIIAADGRGDLPFGSAAAESETFQTKVTASLERAASTGVQLHFFALSGVAGEPPAFLGAIADPGASGNSFRRVPQPQLGKGFFELVSLPYVRRVEVLDLRTGKRVRDVALRQDGRFAVQVPVQGGANPLLVTGITSEGVRVEREFIVDFDDSLIRERLRAAERERMRKERERLGKVEITPVE